MKKNSSQLFLFVIVPATISFVLASACKHSGLMLFNLSLIILTIATFYVKKVMRSNGVDEVKGQTSSLKKGIKWSPSMGPFTWERVQEIIEKKNKNWRFPIREELKGRYFFRTHNYDSKYWMADQRIFSEAYSKETVAGRGVKAYLYLVREV